jgi:hypothetical protein
MGRQPCLSTMLSRSTPLSKAQTWCVGANGAWAKAIKCGALLLPNKKE